MINISPFAALRPKKEFAKELGSRPYDVMNRSEAKAEATENSFLKVTRSEISLPDDVYIHDDKVYKQAKINLQTLVENGVLFKEEKPCYYIYQLIMDGRHQTGLVCGSSVNDYENDLIKKHEFTRPEKELDRINHIKTTRAQTGNVFLAYRNVNEIDVLIEQIKANQPIYDYTAIDGIKHTIWVVNSDDQINEITQLFKTKVPNTYIADGHHRAASAAKVRSQIEELTPESNYFLSTIFPSNQLLILDYNRVVKDLNGHSIENLLELIEQNFYISKKNFALKPNALHEFGMYLNNQWYQLIAKENTFPNDSIGVLDVSILQNNILTPLLNIDDPRTNTRIDFVGSMRGINGLQKRVDSGEMAIAFSLFPVSIQQLFNIADDNSVMPPKSTWFEPKLRDGLLTLVF